jgi:beta-lactam-binding protein with PASTA domain
MKKPKLGLIVCVVGLICLLTAGAALASKGATSSQSASSVRVPRVEGRRLDIADAMLRLRALRPVEHGGGFFGIVVKHNWQVCMQSPSAGSLVRPHAAVGLYVSRPGTC